MAIGAVINAVWDLYARRAGKPLWKLLADMTPEQLVSLVDFRHITDVLTPDEALEILRRRKKVAWNARRSSCETAIRRTRHRLGGWAIRTRR